MKRGGSVHKYRVGKGMALRAALAVPLAALGWFSVTHSLALAVSKTNPARAYAIAPYDGRIAARMAASLVLANPTEDQRRRADALASAALRSDPTAVVAAATLGLSAGMSGDAVAARRFFSLAQKLSRRELSTQLWWIEDSVARNDITQALHHYDIALRTSPGMFDTLFPVLASASSDPAIQGKLIALLATNPRWGRDFVTYVANTDTDPLSTSRLLLGLRRAGFAVPGEAFGRTINVLMGRGLWKEAWAVYASLHPGADPTRSRDPEFSAENSTQSVLDWMPLGEDGVLTSIQNNAFEFAASASVGGPLLQQQQLLPPGRYRLSGRSRDADQAERVETHWVLLCQDQREIGRLAVKEAGAFSGEFRVPANCPVQMLRLVARPSDAMGSVGGYFEHVNLVPVG
jgi:hypothetical protein